MAQPVEDVITEETAQERFMAFLDECTVALPADEDGISNQTQPYVAQAERIARDERHTLYIDFVQLEESDYELSVQVMLQYYRFEPYLRKAVQGFMKKHQSVYVSGQGDGLYQKDREFYISFYNLRDHKKLRDLNTEQIGRLVGLIGTVTRASAVHPELLFGSFRCLDCNSIVENIEQQFVYTEPTKCVNRDCSNTKSWELDMEHSTFVDFQRIRVQENAQDIPSGSMPRTMDVVLRHEAVEKAKPGDKVLISGMLFAMPDVSQLRASGDKTQLMRGGGGVRGRGGAAAQDDGITGLRSLGVRELNYRLGFLGSSVQSTTESHGALNIMDSGDEDVSFTDQEIDMFEMMKESDGFFEKLASSVAPGVFGCQQIKESILLMLLGGVHKKTPEGINLRGDLNVCIVGDPSTAKSQFLKFVSSFVPRAVYASGKSSSAAGLTASVVKDADTEEYMIEAGALMLADNGVCCIDEFDQMNTRDQVAIHEAMEQQTISIVKAGIKAVLNARTSILAAANPVFGRYDTSRGLQSNLNLTLPILSRFDLFQVITDQQDDAVDFSLAQHIARVHQHLDDALAPEYSADELKRYIRYARTINPILTPDAMVRLHEKYAQLRANEIGSGKLSRRITVRQLESLIRLSEAVARALLCTDVDVSHVERATQLLENSIVTLEVQPITIGSAADGIEMSDVQYDRIVHLALILLKDEEEGMTREDVLGHVVNTIIQADGTVSDGLEDDVFAVINELIEQGDLIVINQDGEERVLANKVVRQLM